MSPEVPEYYRHLVEKKPGQEAPAKPGTSQRAKPGPGDVPAKAAGAPYVADSFTLPLPEGWTDRTIFTLTGPVTDGVQHNITVNIDREVVADTLPDFAALQIQSLENQLRGIRLLKEEKVLLANGTPAYRAIFVWYPVEDVRLYQEQLYVLEGGLGYTLTASFTKKTRKTIGPAIERIMLSFEPKRPAG
ncbi:MAG: DUF1795 domain-containing protein [Rhodothermia bacterium]|nr:DUF1795 domain-containing protein [Rhodothermia bacterium]